MASIRPISPENFTAITDKDSIVLKWDEKDADYDILSIEYSVSEGNWLPLMDMEPGEGTYTHKNINPAAKYNYRLKTKKRFKFSNSLLADATTKKEVETIKTENKVTIKNKKNGKK